MITYGDCSSPNVSYRLEIDVLYSTSLMLSDHFLKGICRNATYSLEGNGRIARNALDASTRSIRKQCEENLHAEAEKFISKWLK